MKIKKILIISASALAILSSCTDGFESDNTNPNQPVTAPIYGIFNNSTKQVVNYSRGSFGSARATLPWMQYSAQFEYTEEDRYRVRTGTEGNLFNTYYIHASNFKQITRFCDDGSAAQYGNVDNQLAASRIMLSYIFQNLVDTFGDVPYWSYGNQDPDFQALDVTNVAPKYASQEKIYADILNELKQAAQLIDETKPIFTISASFVGEKTFGNDPVKLKKFANSLRLRVANRIKGYGPLSAIANQHIAELIADPSQLIQSHSESVGVKFENNSINPAPQYTAFFLGDRRNDYTISSQFMSLLKGQVTSSGINTVDPRLQQFVMTKGTPITEAATNNYPKSNDLSLYQGMPFGITNTEASTQRVGTQFSFLSYNVLRPDYTEYYMEYSEVEFLLSENNGWSQTHYLNGVRASMEKWGVETAQIDAYILALPTANQENVLNQKYIALFMQPYEAWAEYRRTGFPNFIVKPGDTVQLINPINGNLTTVFNLEETLTESLNDTPRRLLYPFTEQTLNGNNYTQAASNIGGDKLGTKLIFDRNY